MGRGRNSDNTLVVEGLGWAPEISLAVGLEQTYWWVLDQMTAA
jgi:nucleoside-diphosphate-sugar epimerase